MCWQLEFDSMKLLVAVDSKLFRKCEEFTNLQWVPVENLPLKHNKVLQKFHIERLGFVWKY